MDAIDKKLARLSDNDREFYLALFARIRGNKLEGLDIKKLAGSRNLYRIRHGSWRILFERWNSQNEILWFGRRNEKTYRDL